MKKKIIITIAFFLGAFFITSWMNSIRRNSGEVFNELAMSSIYLEESKEDNQERKLSISENKIDEIVKRNVVGYEDNISVYYYNLDNGDEYIYNGDKYYVAASTTKIPLAMLAFDDVSNGTYSLNTKIQYKDEDYEEGTGILYYQDYIEPLTVEEAVYLSIVHSDNVAKNMLKRIGTISNYEYISSIVGENYEQEENHYNAKELGQILKELYYNEEENPYYDKIIEYMKETEFHDRMDKYLPYSEVAHKIGSYYRYYHDMGIVYGEENYILVVMTKDVGELQKGYFEEDDERNLLDYGEQASELIANISYDIYNLIENY